MTKPGRIFLLLLVAGVFVGVMLLVRPFIKGSVSVPGAATTGAVSADDGIIVAAEPGYITSWRVGADGKLTRLDTQQTVSIERRLNDAAKAQ